MLACLDARGRPICREHEGPWADVRPDPMDVLVDIDPADPNRCTCPECDTVYETPPSVVCRILWHVVRTSVRTPHTSVREAIAAVMGERPEVAEKGGAA